MRPASLILALLAAAGTAAAQAPGQEDPAANEQLLIYELNRARNNPQRYAAENSLGALLDSVNPSPPLAVNGTLVHSASFHAEEMAANDYFSHQSAVTGDWPNKMARNAGYVLPGFWGDNFNYIESLAAGYSDVLAALKALIEDSGTSPPGHRYHLLATGPDANFWLAHREIGTGYDSNGGSTYVRYYAIHTAYVNSGDLFLTGVVYDDANANNRYDLNEGLGGVTVSDGTNNVLTNPEGGWSLPTVDGNYTVTATGGPFTGTGTANVVVSGANVEIDFISGDTAGEIDFANQGGPGAPPIPPSNLAAVAVSDSQIDLTWNDNSSDETGFKVERRTEPGGLWTEIVVTAANATAYSDMTVAESTTYSYRVRAAGASSDSTYSNTAQDTTPSSQPDADGDGMPDAWETANGTNPAVDDATGDLDGDGFPNLYEYQEGTDPDDAASFPPGDTDGDGLPNAWEVQYGLDPLVNDAFADPDGDGATNLEEYAAGTDPNSAPPVPPDDDDDDGICGSFALELMAPLGLLWLARRRRR